MGQLLALRNEKDQSVERSAGELIELQAGQKRLGGACQSELLSLYDLIIKFTKLTADIEDGKHPFVYRDGLKEVVLAAGARPALPSLDTYPHLFSAIAKDEEEKALSVSHGRPTSAIRRRAGAGGIAAVA